MNAHKMSKRREMIGFLLVFRDNNRSCPLKQDKTEVPQAGNQNGIKQCS